MPTIRLTQTIDRPITEVFTAVADASVYPAWNPTMQCVDKITAGSLQQGTRFQASAQGFGQFEMTISEYEPPARVKLSSATKMANMYHLFVLTSAGRATRVDHDVTIRPKGIYRLMSLVMGMMLQRNIKKATGALKTYVERGSMAS